MTEPTTPPTDTELAAVQTAIDTYRRHPSTGFACCTAHPVADAGAMLLEEINRLKGQRKYLLDQLARKDAATGEGDRALREFLDAEVSAESATSAPLAASHGPAGAREGETAAEGAAGRVGDSGVDASGTAGGGR